MATMHTIRTVMPLQETDERMSSAITAAVAKERLQQAGRVDAAYRAGAALGNKLARSRIPYSIAWLSGFVTGAALTLVAGRFL